MAATIEYSRGQAVLAALQRDNQPMMYGRNNMIRMYFYRSQFPITFETCKQLNENSGFHFKINDVVVGRYSGYSTLLLYSDVPFDGSLTPTLKFMSGLQELKFNVDYSTAVRLTGRAMETNKQRLEDYKQQLLKSGVNPDMLVVNQHNETNHYLETYRLLIKGNKKELYLYDQAREYNNEWLKTIKSDGV